MITEKVVLPLPPLHQKITPFKLNKKRKKTKIPPRSLAIITTRKIILLPIILKKQKLAAVLTIFMSITLNMKTNIKKTL